MFKNKQTNMAEDIYSDIEMNANNFLDYLRNSLREKIANDANYAEAAAEEFVDSLIDELLLEVVGDVHRAITLGYSDILFSKIYDYKHDENEFPFYPESEDSKTEDINCPKCHKLIHASRFAPHLEKCMKQGRSSSRIASQRIANNSKDCSYGIGSDEEEEWKAEKPKGMKKLDGKKKKDSVRKQKQTKADISKMQREPVVTPTSSKEVFQSPNKSIKDNYGKGVKEHDIWISPNKMVPLTGDDKFNLLSSRCGVKSFHTGKYCGRSLRCPLHSDAERAVARKLLSAESMDIDVEETDYSKSVIGSFSQLDLTPNTPTSKRKEKQRQGISKY